MTHWDSYTPAEAAYVQAALARQEDQEQRRLRLVKEALAYTAGESIQTQAQAVVDRLFGPADSSELGDT